MILAHFPAKSELFACFFDSSGPVDNGWRQVLFVSLVPAPLLKIITQPLAESCAL
jgi:hypothetical protein